MAKVRVYELAKEFGVESKVVMAKLQELGEFVRSASSTVEPPVVRKLKEAFPVNGGADTSAQPQAPGKKTATKKAAPDTTAAVPSSPAPAEPLTPLPASVPAAGSVAIPTGWRMPPTILPSLSSAADISTLPLANTRL